MVLSVIIPVYNVEPYVGKVLESVFVTTASTEDFEVIVVNDGSEDGSMDVVRQFAGRPNLTVIEQENRGLGAARMKGLSVASGEYVWFVDSDDWLVEGGVGKVLNLLAGRPGAEVLRFPLRWIREDGTEDERWEHVWEHPLDKELVVDGRTLVRDLHMEVGGSQRFVLLRSLFSDPRLYFPEGVLFEDVYFGAVLITVVGRFHVMPESIYCYRIRGGSIMRTLKVDSCYDMVSVHKMVMRFKEEAVAPADWPWFDKYYFRRLEYAYARMEHCLSSPQFRLFTLTKGGYVWKRWKEVHPEASWKTDLKQLMRFLAPTRLPL